MTKDTKKTDFLRYDRMVESALRDVVRQAVQDVIDNNQSMPGEHHFYITFRTDHAGIQIPNYLKERYPNEMTIVLQFQFEGLKIDKNALYVNLSFNNVPENLIIPLKAITIFADPSVNFVLQFQPISDDHGDDDKTPDPEPKGKKTTDTDSTDNSANKVISLDQFRKK
jgi:hypothetical protein